MAEERQQIGIGEGVFPSEMGLRRRLESAYYSVSSRMTPEGYLMLGSDVELLPTQECPAFASPGTRAYEARDRRQSAGEEFVLVCAPGSVPRVTCIGSYKNLKNLNALRLIEAGIVNWAPEGRQKFAFVFEKPQGKKILASPDAQPYRISEDKLVHTLIAPAVRALADFRDIELVHGAINAENIYLTGDGGLERLVLGECLSSAPFWRQNPLYEMPARAAAQASGRGPGTVAHDLYALGVCVAMWRVAKTCCAASLRNRSFTRS
jgi:hypothetical protein